MDAAVRWSPHSSQHKPRFLIIDVAANRLRYCESSAVKDHDFRNNPILPYKTLSVRDKLSNFTAFDWSKTEESLVAIGSASGEATLLNIDPDKPPLIHSFPIRHQRKCNSVAFSSEDLLATGLDRVRNDHCMNIYDFTSSTTSEPYRKFASSEAITSIKFFTAQPQTLIAGVLRQCLRLYDLRGKFKHFLQPY